MSRIVSLLLSALAVIVLMLLFAPVCVVVLLSFFAALRGQVDWSSASFAWYARIAQNDKVIDALFNSLIVGAISVAITLVLASIIAMYVVKKTGFERRLLEALVFLPFLLPPILTGLSLLIFFQDIALERSLVTVTIGHVVFLMAIVYRIVLNRLQALNRNMVEASSDLGAGHLQTFFFVVLPHLRLSLVTSGLLAFTMSFDETLITILLSGGDQTLPIRLWAMMRVGITPEINALVTVVLLATVSLALIIAALVRMQSSLTKARP